MILVDLSGLFYNIMPWFDKFFEIVNRSWHKVCIFRKRLRLTIAIWQYEKNEIAMCFHWLHCTYRISVNSFRGNYFFWKWKMWTFSYSFRIAAILVNFMKQIFNLIIIKKLQNGHGVQNKVNLLTNWHYIGCVQLVNIRKPAYNSHNCNK